MKNYPDSLENLRCETGKSMPIAQAETAESTTTVTIVAELNPAVEGGG